MTAFSFRLDSNLQTEQEVDTVCQSASDVEPLAELCHRNATFEI